MLPFVELSCQGRAVFVLSGVQLVTGAEVEVNGGGPGKAKLHQVDREVLVVGSLVCAIAAVAACYLRGRASTLAPAVAGGLGFACLMAAKMRMDAEAVAEGQGAFVIVYRSGFILASIGMLVGTIVSAVQCRSSRSVKLHSHAKHNQQGST
jgi:hypothetical protein